MATQVYELTVSDHHHRVETSVGDGWSNEATWWVDGEQLATRTSTTEDNLYLSADKGHALADTAGALRVRFTTLNKPVRATWFEGSREKASTASHVGSGGIDLVPAPGSPAALREEKMRTNPRLYAAGHVAGGVGKVLVPLIAAVVVAWLLSRVSLPDLDLPDLPWPSIDLPSIPWPEIPWPSYSLPSGEVPDWLVWVLEHLKYVWPILLGVWLARREVTRRRTQDALREEMAAGRSANHTGDDPADRSAVRDIPADETEDAEPEEDQPTHARDE